MALIYSTTPHDTEEIIALRQLINDNERAFSDIRTIHSDDQRRLCDEYDALMAAQRPTYPTPEHLQGLDMVADMMRAGTEYGDHHGSPRQVDREAGRALRAASTSHRSPAGSTSAPSPRTVPARRSTRGSSQRTTSRLSETS